MTYQYECSDCGRFVDKSFPMGTAPKEVVCECGKSGKRTFSNAGFLLQGQDWPSRDISFKKSQTKKNEEAGIRMRKNHKPMMKLAALDYGNGDIREV